MHIRPYPSFRIIAALEIPDFPASPFPPLFSEASIQVITVETRRATATDPSGIGAWLLLNGTDPASRLSTLLWSASPSRSLSLPASRLFSPSSPRSRSRFRFPPLDVRPLPHGRRRDTLEKFQFIQKVVMTECTNTCAVSRTFTESIHISWHDVNTGGGGIVA